MAVTTEKSAGATATRPFKVEIRQEEIDELRRRLRATRWPEKETVADESQGVQLATMQELARYWATDYDWRKARGEAQRVSALHHRDRRRGHPLHPRQVGARERAAGDHHPRLARLGRGDARLIGPLTDPTAHGGNAEDAFHLVLPSMPGYGLSGKPTELRLGPGPDRASLVRAHAATRLHPLRGSRRRLGRPDHRRDGREGAPGADRHPLQHARHRPGRHRQGPRLERPRSRHAADRLSADEQRAYDRLNFLYTKGIGYVIEMGTRPQTLYGLPTPPSPSPPGCSTTTPYSYDDIASAFSRASRSATSPATTSSTTSPSLADEHRGLLGPPVLGEHARLLRRRSASPFPPPSASFPREI